MSIETDTPILPFVVADSVVREVGGYLNWEYPQDDSVQTYLADYAERVYAHNPMFAKRINTRRAEIGRDTLYAFMRHWMAGWIKDNLGCDMFHRLPQSYCVGRELPKVSN
jgi:hypothetical protein